MEGARHPLLDPDRPPWRGASLLLALGSARLIVAAAPSDASAPWRAAAGGVPVVLALLPTLVARAFVARDGARGGDAWSASRRAALATLAVGLLLAMVGVAWREASAVPRPLQAPHAPWPLEELVAVQALLFVAQLLPLPGSDGAVLIEAALRRSRPQLVATRLAGRLRGSALALLALLLALLPGGGRDPLSLATAAATLAIGVAAERRAFRLALARELLLQQGVGAAAGAPPLRPLAPAQFPPFAALAQRAYERLAGARRSSAKPSASASSSTPTEPA